MDWMTILEEICKIALFPIIGAAALYLVALLNAKTKELQEKTKNEKAQKYLALLNDTITTCVIATSQTYVNVLKAEGIFDKEAQEIALKKTYDAVIKSLTADAWEILNEVVGDLEEYILNSIESNVATTKSYIKF